MSSRRPKWGDDGLVDIRNDEDPLERTAETDVGSEQACSKSGDRRVIDGS